MRRSLLILFLYCLCIISPCVSVETSSTGNSVIGASASSSSSDDVTADESPRERLLNDILERYLQLTGSQLVLSTELIKKVLSDKDVLSVDTDKMRAEQSIMENFVRHVEQKETEIAPPKNKVADRFFYLVSKTLIYQEFEAIERRHRFNTKYTTPENIVIRNVLEKNDYAMYQSDLQKSERNFIERLHNSIEEYIKGLTPQAKQKEHKLLDWYNKMKVETDLQVQMQHSFEFLRFFLKY